MANILEINAPSFAQSFKTLLSDKLESAEHIHSTVNDIINQVQTQKDQALLELTNRFDQSNAQSIKELCVVPETIEAAYKQAPEDLKEALNLAKNRIESYHKKQLPKNTQYTDDIGTTLGYQYTPVDAVGLYVPGGTAAYPSSVLMNAIPAKVAGVERLAMVVPAPQGNISPLVLAAAHLADISELYLVGGAQAIAALAYGTETIAPVDTIVGPGNAYVAAAKKHIYGTTGIDMIAGPSEILVVSDNKSNPEWIAADLLSQAEHDTAARAILITDSKDFAKTVANTIETILPTLERQSIAQESWQRNGAIIITNTLEEAIPLINSIATEHLELAIDTPETWLPKIKHAGAIFLGRYTPEAIGDYTAGPSHVLPTATTARFSSGLSVFDFLKRSSIISCTQEAFNSLSKPTALLASQEGLSAHALSVTLRTEQDDT